MKASKAVKQIEMMFDAINKDSFNGEIPAPIITIKETAGAYGHASVGEVWEKGRKSRRAHELNIAAGTLNRPIAETCATLIHEMTHLYNLKNNIQDVSRSGYYHNKKFKEEAEKHMITIDYNEKIGWSITSPTKELRQYIKEKQWKKIDLKRQEFIKDKATGTKSNSRKYVCPACGAIVRATKDMEDKIACIPCSIQNRKAGGDLIIYIEE